MEVLPHVHVVVWEKKIEVGQPVASPQHLM